MAAAARLAVKGHRVTVLEHNGTYGGKLGTYERDGFRFDTGPSLLTLPAVYRDLFIKTGRAELDEVVDIQALDPAFRYRWHDGTVTQLPGAGTGKIAAALGAALGADAGEQWRGLMQHAAEVWQLTRRPILESPLSGPKDLLALATNRQDIATVAPWKSLRKLGKQHLTDPRLLMLLDRYATYTGSDPRRAPSALVTVPYVEQNFGAWHLGGGIRTLADALYDRLLERKVDVRFHTTVENITVVNDAVTAVVTSTGEQVPADVVVANADAHELYTTMLPERYTKKARRQLRQATPSFSGFVLLLAVEGTTPDLAHHNVWFPSNYDREFDELFAKRPQPVADPTIYACVPKDALMAPNGYESWFILINAPRHGHGVGMMDWHSPGIAEKYAAQILEILAGRGVDLRPRIKWQVIRTPADLSNETLAPGGAIYGTSSNGVRAAFLRPSNIGPVTGLYLVGGSAHPGGGLPLVGMSAEIVANLIGRDD